MPAAALVVTCSGCRRAATAFQIARVPSSVYPSFRISIRYSIPGPDSISFHAFTTRSMRSASLHTGITVQHRPITVTAFHDVVLSCADLSPSAVDSDLPVGASRAARFVYRLRTAWLRIAISTAFREPTTQTSLRPRVMAVYRRFLWSSL